MRAVPALLAEAEPRVVRPRDLRGVYANPAKELRDFERQGVVVRLAHGYYGLVPEERRADGGWVPSVEAVALAIGQVDYGRDGAALMGLSAARLLGALPRAVGAAAVAVAKQRPALETVVGAVTFVTRTVHALDVRRVDTELATGWATTAEQTLIDVADRPRLAGLAAADAVEVVAALAARADRDLVTSIAQRLRKRAALDVVRRLWADDDWRAALEQRC